MKVAVINFSGNVGKTTVSAHLLKPRMGEAPIFSVESLNVDAAGDGLDVERLRGKEFGDLQGEMLRRDDAIVDVGASNIEDFMKLMQKYHGSHEDFDYFVVPVVKEKKQQADTVNTIRALKALGVPAKKIRVLFNKVDVDDNVDHDFASIFGLAEIEKSFTLRPEAVIHQNEVYELLKVLKTGLSEVLADDTDYRAKLKESADENERDRAVRMIAVKRLAVSATSNLDAAYKALFK